MGSAWLSQLIILIRDFTAPRRARPTPLVAFVDRGCHRLDPLSLRDPPRREGWGGREGGKEGGGVRGGLRHQVRVTEEEGGGWGEEDGMGGWSEWWRGEGGEKEQVK